MRLVKIPNFIQKIFPKVLWKVDTQVGIAHLTFDDGPTPGVTDWVLDTLKEHGVKGTFFCIGRNVEKHPKLFQRILDEGHIIGNHSYSHVRGMYKNPGEYLKDISLASELIKAKLFRPPHGRITPGLVKELSETYQVVMWDILSYDYDKSLAPKVVLKNVTSHIKSGSIIVFHDSLKAEKNLKYSLPKLLEFMARNNLKGEGILG